MACATCYMLPCQPFNILTGSWPVTLWAAGWSGPAAACRWDPAASRSWAASARSGPSSGCFHSSTPCCGASPYTGWRCSWLSMSVDSRDTELSVYLNMRGLHCGFGVKETFQPNVGVSFWLEKLLMNCICILLTLQSEEADCLEEVWVVSPLWDSFR